MNARTRGFTLIELLVVIAIISLLATLAMSATGAVRVLADRSASASNLRQWGGALLLYTGDNNGALPRRGQGKQPLAQINRPDDWFNALPPYFDMPAYMNLVAQGIQPRAGDKSVFICPGVLPQKNQKVPPYFLGYGMNMNLSPWNIATPTQISDIRAPLKVVFMGEAPGAYSSVYPSTAAYSVIAPHGGKGNLLFLDGHVSSFASSEIGCGTGDSGNPAISWKTGTAADANAAQY